MIDPPSLVRTNPPKGYPDHVDVLGQRWNIVYVANLMGDHGMFGKTDMAQRTLLIDTQQSPASMSETLWHEVMHAALHTSALHDLDDSLEEKVVRTLAPAVESVLRSCRSWWR